MRYLLITLLLCSCGIQPGYHFIEAKNQEWQEIVVFERCLNGVVYYQINDGLAPKFKANSKVGTCND